VLFGSWGLTHRRQHLAVPDNEWRPAQAWQVIQVLLPMRMHRIHAFNRGSVSWLGTLHNPNRRAEIDERACSRDSPTDC